MVLRVMDAKGPGTCEPRVGKKVNDAKDLWLEAAPGGSLARMDTEEHPRNTGVGRPAGDTKVESVPFR